MSALARRTYCLVSERRHGTDDPAGDPFAAEQARPRRAGVITPARCSVILALDRAADRLDDGRMSKYLPLATFLRRQKSQTVVLTFAEIERIVSGLLPKASADPAWWQANATSPQPQQRILFEAGFTAAPDFRAETVRFSRTPKRPSAVGAASDVTAQTADR